MSEKPATALENKKIKCSNYEIFFLLSFPSRWEIFTFYAACVASKNSFHTATAVATIFLENYFATLLFLCSQHFSVSFLNVKHFVLFVAAQCNFYMPFIHIFSSFNCSFYDKFFLIISLIFWI